MIIGDVRRFAVEYEILIARDEKWIYGPFFFWINGIRFGDEEDDGVVLTACANWAESVSPEDQGYLNQQYYEMSTQELFERTGDISEISSFDYGFHVRHIGMSAFDRYDEKFVLVKDRDFNERLMYCSERIEPGSIILEPGEFEDVLGQFVRSFREAARALLAAGQESQRTEGKLDPD